MVEIFKAFLIPSFVGALLTGLMFSVGFITRKFFSAKWHYYMGVIILLVMILPVRFTYESQPRESFEEEIQVIGETGAKSEFSRADEAEYLQPMQSSDIQMARNIIEAGLPIAAHVWIFGIVILGALRIFGYAGFCFKLHRKTDVVLCEEIREYTKRNVTVRKSGEIASPLIVGLLKPILLLPNTELSYEQMSNVLKHEMTHLNRNDILIKWFVSFVKTVCWYNAAVYFLASQIERDCEISCDAAVTKKMNDDEKKGYMETILSMVCYGKKLPTRLTTGMACGKKELKRRFLMIKENKIFGKLSRIVSVVLAVVILSSALFASSVLAGSLKDDTYNLQEAWYTVVLSCSDKSVKITDTILEKDGVIYLPLGETMNIFGDVEQITCNYFNRGIDTEWRSEEIYVSKEIDGLKKYYYFIFQKARNYVTTNYGDGAIGIEEAKAGEKMTIHLQNSPVRKNGITYVPEDYLDLCMGHKMKSEHVYVRCITDKIMQPLDLIMPTKGFGKLRNPVTGEVSFHEGIDLWAADGMDVKASIDGQVVEAGFDVKMGNYIKIADDNAVEVMHGHLRDIYVTKGDMVTKDAVIGTAGRTGAATGVFLHFEISRNGVYYNPERFLG